LKGSIFRANDEESRVLFTSLNRQLGEVRQLQHKIMRDFAIRQNHKIVKYQIKNELKFAIRETEKILDNLKARAHDQEAVLANAINNRITNFYWLLSISFIAGFILCYTVGLQMFVEIFRWVREFRDKFREISYGNLPEHFPPQKSEFNNLANFSNRLIDNLNSLRNYAVEVGKGHFSTETKIFGANSTLGKSLTEMGLSLQKVYDEEKTRNWITEGLAEFGETLRFNSQNLDSLCRETISQLVRHLEAIQGGFFILNREAEPWCFELKASFAYGRQKFIERKIEINEGLLGRVFNEREKVYLTEIPANYIEVTSGLGSTKPKTLILLPLLNDEQEIQGAIELASFKEFEEYQLDFLAKLCNTIASTITIVIATQKNQKLLIDSQKIAETLRQKEEEARQNAIELSRLREQTERDLFKTRSELARLNLVLNELHWGVVLFNNEGKIEFFNHTAEQIFGYESDEVINRNIRVIIPQEYLNENEDEGSNELLQMTKTTKKVEAIRKDGSKVLLHLDLTELENKDDNFFMILVKAD
jgi:PAS domain S-box-containing protein